MKFEEIEAGMKLYDIRKKKGNIETYSISVISVNPDNRTIVAKYNGNPEVTMDESQYSEYKAERPVVIRVNGYWKLATKAEIKKMEEAKASEGKPRSPSP